MRVEEKMVMFPCREIRIEGRYSVPPGQGAFPAVVVCHPHPLYGGMMDNNVVLGIYEALSEGSVIPFRFNFRGVGDSGGAFAQGIGEQEDAIAALSFVASLKEVDPARIGLAGYSFGAGVAIGVLSRGEQVPAVAVVSLPITPANSLFLREYQRPKLLLCGDRDDFIPREQFQSFAQSLSQPCEYEVIPGADHFWWGHEKVVGKRVAAFFVQALR